MKIDHVLTVLGVAIVSCAFTAAIVYGERMKQAALAETKFVKIVGNEYGMDCIKRTNDVMYCSMMCEKHDLNISKYCINAVKGNYDTDTYVSLKGIGYE